jgi:hypothetical protein
MTTRPRKPTKAVLAHLKHLQDEFDTAALVYASATATYVRQPLPTGEQFDAWNAAGRAWAAARTAYIKACSEAGVDPTPRESAP